jgi:transcriptional regulator with XRE-family HTH domain
MQFAKMIKDARKRAKLSQRALAAQLITEDKPNGVWATYIGQIEKGEKVPSDEVCLMLATVLNLDPNTVLLMAYQSKANSPAGKALFKMMKRSLIDPVARKLLAGKLAPAVLEVIANPEIQDLLVDQQWLEAMARARKLQKKRDVLTTLRDIEAMNDKQWEATQTIIRTMDLHSPE